MKRHRDLADSVSAAWTDGGDGEWADSDMHDDVMEDPMCCTTSS